MAEPFIAEVRMFACNFPPKNWAFCDGSIIAIRQNSALFSLIGSNFGGNGTVNFGLPNFKGTCAPGAGTGPGIDALQIGQTGGEVTHTLTTEEMALHGHNLMGQPPGRLGGGGDSEAPVDHVLASPNGQLPYAAPGTLVAMADVAVAAGGGGAHNNMQPYLAVNFCIAMAGIFPPRS